MPRAGTGDLPPAAAVVSSARDRAEGQRTPVPESATMTPTTSLRERPERPGKESSSSVGPAPRWRCVVFPRPRSYVHGFYADRCLDVVQPPPASFVVSISPRADPTWFPPPSTPPFPLVHPPRIPWFGRLSCRQWCSPRLLPLPLLIPLTPSPDLAPPPPTSPPPIFPEQQNLTTSGGRGRPRLLRGGGLGRRLRDGPHGRGRGPH